MVYLSLSSRPQIKNFLATAALSAACVFSVFSPLSAMAEPVRNTSEGVDGYVDKQRRNPILTVSHEVKEGGTEILADAYLKHGSLGDFPIQFDFYIDRKLYSSQYRSQLQKGPIGIFVPESDHPAPFNYTVIATLLHTNRQYKTIYEATAFSSQLTSTLDCELTIIEDGQDTVFLSKDVSSTQPASNRILLAFEGEEEVLDPTESKDKKTVSVTLDTNESMLTADGTIAVKESDAEFTIPVSYNVSGSYTLEEGKLASLSVSSADGLIDLSCD